MISQLRNQTDQDANPEDVTICKEDSEVKYCEKCLGKYNVTDDVAKCGSCLAKQNCNFCGSCQKQLKVGVVFKSVLSITQSVSFYYRSALTEIQPN